MCKRSSDGEAKQGDNYLKSEPEINDVRGALTWLLSEQTEVKKQHRQPLFTLKLSKTRHRLAL
jgi:hypothetical protein